MSRTNAIAIPAWTEPANLDVAKRQIWDLGQTMHEHAYLVGRTLLWVKRDVGHTNFLAWIEKNVWFSHDTASRMVEFARNCDKAGRMLSYHPTKNRTVRNLPVGGETIISSLQAIMTSGRKFATIYADPPWPYQNRGTRAAAEKHYPTMTLDQIADLSVADLAQDNAHLHLWTTNAFLFAAQQIMVAWGFEYKSCFVWVKPEMGIGNYWRVSHEFLLFGLRGKCPFNDRGILSWLEIPRGPHSAKPEQIRALIERVSPPPRIELFGRRSAEGWTVVGNEIPTTLMEIAHGAQSL